MSEYFAKFESDRSISKQDTIDKVLPKVRELLP